MQATSSTQDALPKQLIKPAAPTVRPVYVALAWGMMLAILTPSIIWAWVPIARPVILAVWNMGIFWPYGLLALSALSFLWVVVRPLRGFLLAFLALQTGAMLVFMIASNAAYADWVKTLPLGPRILLTPQFGVGLRLITVALLAVTLIGSGLKRRDLFLARSDLKAPFQFFGRSMPWWLVGGLMLLGVIGGTSLYLVLSTHVSAAALPRVVLYLPFILIAAAINAFVEEFGWRSVLLARLTPVLGPGQANTLQATYWGLSHYWGTPGGLVGSLMVFALGWLFGKSVMQTRGSTVNYVVHVAADATVFAFFVMAVS
jgi:membrane protease YdiL (CAAX protease family)